MSKALVKSKITSVSFGSPFSYEMKGEYLIRRFLGIFPVSHVHLGAVHYLRLAARNEVSPAYFLMNWPQLLLANYRQISPVYILQTRKGQTFFLKMKGGAHFRLRQSIARHSDRKSHQMAA